MRVRMIHAVDEDLLAIRFHAQAGGLLAVHAMRIQGFDVAHANARHPFRGEHTLGRELVNHARMTTSLRLVKLAAMARIAAASCW